MTRRSPEKSGQELEARIKAQLQEALASGRLGLAPTSAKVFQGKGYFSRDRHSNIKTDISIEIFRPGQGEPWFLWIWECKDYAGAVPVGDIEEFHTKLEQIGADKTKGTVVTSSRFQKAAIEFAKANGIGLVRRAPDGSIIYLLEGVRLVTDEHLLRGLTTEDTRQIESLFYGLTPSGEGFTQLDHYLAQELTA